MKKLSTFFAVFTLATLVSLSFIGVSSNFGVNGWELLGSKKVNYGLDKDVVTVGAYEGSFKQLKIKVGAGALNMHKMVVVYGNGSRQEIALKYRFHKGATSRTIDLQGNNRAIKKVIFWYDTKNTSNRRATLYVMGR